MWMLLWLASAQAGTVPGQLGVRINTLAQPLAPSWADERPALRLEPEYVIDGAVRLGRAGWWGLRWEEDPIKPVRSRAALLQWGLRSRDFDPEARRYGFGRLAAGVALGEHVSGQGRVGVAAWQVVPSAGIGVPLWKEVTLELGVEAQMQWAFDVRVTNAAPESGFSFATVGVSTGIVFGP